MILTNARRLIAHYILEHLLRSRERSVTTMMDKMGIKSMKIFWLRFFALFSFLKLESRLNCAVGILVHLLANMSYQ